MCLITYSPLTNKGTPSPARKKRNNSTPTKNKADEKRLIIETLIAPATIDTRPKVNIPFCNKQSLLTEIG